MRLLPVGPNHEYRGTLDTSPSPYRQRHRPSHGRQYLSLRVLDVARVPQLGLPLGPHHGQGIAIHPSFGGYPAQATEITLTSRGLRVDRIVCVRDCSLVVNPNIVQA